MVIKVDSFRGNFVKKWLLTVVTGSLMCSAAVCMNSVVANFCDGRDQFALLENSLNRHLAGAERNMALWGAGLGNFFTEWAYRDGASEALQLFWGRLCKIQTSCRCVPGMVALAFDFGRVSPDVFKKSRDLAEITDFKSFEKLVKATIARKLEDGVSENPEPEMEHHVELVKKLIEQKFLDGQSTYGVSEGTVERNLRAYYFFKMPPSEIVRDDSMKLA